MANKEWFVILQQGEFEAMKTGFQILVFAAIKSYCSNGKAVKGLSSRDIEDRTHLSHGTIISIIPELLDLGVIKVVGKETRKGGSVSIYQVVSSRPVKWSAGDHLDFSSGQLVTESGQTVGVNHTQSKKEVKNTKKHFKNNEQNDTPVHEVESKIPPEFADDIFADNGWEDFKK